MKHKVQIGRDNRMYRVEGTEFEEGEEITFYVPFLTDCSISVTSDDVEIRRGTIEGSYGDYVFIFTVPDHDVSISVSMVNDMMRRAPGPMNQPPMGMMGYMGMGGFGMPQTQDAPPAGEGKASDDKAVSGEAAGFKRRPKFCYSCGMQFGESTPRFCTECGAKQDVE